VRRHMGNLAVFNAASLQIIPAPDRLAHFRPLALLPTGRQTNRAAPDPKPAQTPDALTIEI
jgi:hypothetical protein